MRETLREAESPAATTSPIGQSVRPGALRPLVATYGGDTHRLLIDVADLVAARVAYADLARRRIHPDGSRRARR